MRRQVSLALVVLFLALATTITGEASAYAADSLSCTTTYVFASDASSGWHNTDQTVTITASGGTAPRTIHVSGDGGAS